MASSLQLVRSPPCRRSRPRAPANKPPANDMGSAAEGQGPTAAAGLRGQTQRGSAAGRGALCAGGATAGRPGQTTVPNALQAVAQQGGCASLTRSGFQDGCDRRVAPTTTRRFAAALPVTPVTAGCCARRRSLAIPAYMWPGREAAAVVQAALQPGPGAWQAGGAQAAAGQHVGGVYGAHLWADRQIA